MKQRLKITLIKSRSPHDKGVGTTVTADVPHPTVIGNKFYFDWDENGDTQAVLTRTPVKEIIITTEDGDQWKLEPISK